MAAHETEAVRCRSQRTKGILVQCFHALHLKKCSLTEGSIAFSNTLTSPLIHNSVSGIWLTWNLKLYAVLPLQKKRMQVETEGWPCPKLFKSHNDWVDNLFFWVCHARCLWPRPFWIHVNKLALKWELDRENICVSIPHPPSYSTSTSWSLVLSKTRLENFIQRCSHDLNNSLSCRLLCTWK